MPGEITSLDHVVLAVADLEGATRTYARLLGRAPSWRGEHPGAGTANTLFRLENTYVELLAPVGAGAIAKVLEARLEVGEGVFALAFGTDDADACRERLEAAGLQPAPAQNGMGRDTDSGAFREWRRVPLPGKNTRGVMLFAIEHLSPESSLTPGLPAGDERGPSARVDTFIVGAISRNIDAACAGESRDDFFFGTGVHAQEAGQQFAFVLRHYRAFSG